MKTFWRAFSGILLIVLLCTLTAWRNDSLPDMSGVTAMIRSTAEKIDKTTSAIEGAVSDAVTRPIDHSAADGEGVFVEYDLSEPIDESLETAICTGLSELLPEIDVSSYRLSTDALKNIMAQIIYSHPELFYVSSTYNYLSKSDGTVKSIAPTYLYGAEDVRAMSVAYEKCLAEITAGVDPSWSDFDKALYLHDYFIRNYTYDYTYTIRDAYTFFTQKTGVCQAYMLAMIAAGNAVGLEVLPVTSNEMLHAWNLVKVEGNWYHVDLTWDDSSANPAAVLYRYFLQSDTGLVSIDAGENNPHRAWNAGAAASDTAYDQASYRETMTPILKQGDTYYCVLSETNGEKWVHGAIYGGTDVANMAPLHYITAEWMASATSYYTACYSGLGAYNGKLIYNTANTLRMYDPATGKDRQLGMVPGLLGDSLYGIMGISANVVTLVAADSPQSKSRTVTFTLSF